MDKDLSIAAFVFSLFAMLLVILGFIVLLARDAFSQDYNSWETRCSQYRETVEDILKSESVSTDYYYLMVAESRCTIGAKSHKGAQGFWQLMPNTGRHYGCTDLFNLECSTRAAARYIRHLQTSFRKFDDVIIAYNMGGHNYRRAGATKEAIGLLFLVKRLKQEDQQ